MSENIDIIGQTTGNFGKWQLRTILIIFLCKIPTSWFMAIIIFTAPSPKVGEFWCKPPENIKNHTEWIIKSHPIKTSSDKEFKIDFCNVYQEVFDETKKYFQFSDESNLTEVNRANSSIIPCENFVFKSDFHSMIAAYSLVCSRELLTALSQCFHIFGLLVGGIIAYYLLKTFSPRRVMLIGMVCQIACGNLCGFVIHFEMHVLFRFLTAAACALMYTSGQMILADITGSRAKLITIILFELFWSIGLILLPALSIFFDNWAHLYIAISMPTVFLIFLHRLIPDSPRWMIQRGKVDKAKAILIKSAKTNKREIPENIDHLLNLQAAACSKPPPQINWWKLWDGYPNKSYILALHNAWAVYILLFNAMVLNVTSYGPKHVTFNTITMALSEMIGVCFALYLVLYTKRKWLWTGIFSIVSGIIAFFPWFIPDTIKETHIVALTMIPCIAIKITTSSSLSILTSSTADSVNVDKKKILMFSVAIWGRGWFVWAPFIGVMKAYGMLVPLTVFAVMSVVGGILCSFIHYCQEPKEKSHLIAENCANLLQKETFLNKPNLQ